MIKKGGRCSSVWLHFWLFFLFCPEKKNQKSPRFHVFVKLNIYLLSFSFHLDFDFLGELISWMQRSFQDEEFQILLRFFSLSVLALYLVGTEIKQNTKLFYSGSFLQSPNNKQNLSILGLIHVRHMPVAYFACISWRHTPSTGSCSRSSHWSPQITRNWEGDPPFRLSKSLKEG